MKPILAIIGAALKSLFTMVGLPFKGLPFCSLPGAVVGSFTGFVMCVYENVNSAQVLTPQQLVVIALLIGTVGLLLVLFLFGLILRYGVGQILWPALINALLTALLTVFVTHWLNMPAIAGFFGLLIGIIVGVILCWICRSTERRTHG